MEKRELAKNAKQAATFMKTMANDKRLLILCLLAEKEHSVSELEETLGIRQPTLSQQLAILREEGLVDTRRDGKSIYYALASEEAKAMMGLLFELFCGSNSGGQQAAVKRTAGLAARCLAPLRKHRPPTEYDHA